MVKDSFSPGESHTSTRENVSDFPNLGRRVGMYGYLIFWIVGFGLVAAALI